MLPKMYKRAQNGCYYVQMPDRTQVNLGRDKAKAEDEYRRIIGRMESYTSLPFYECADDFLEWVKTNRAPKTYEFYKGALQSFCKSIGKLPSTA